MDVTTPLAILALAALIHASFQLSVSVLTLLSGHTIGAKRTHARLLRLTTSFATGVGVMTLLLLCSISYGLTLLYANTIPEAVWVTSCGILVSVAVLVWLFYYRHGKGTMLWIPRGFARYLNHRTKATRLSAEAFGLGLSSLLGELLFIFAPLSVASLTLIQLPPLWQVAGILTYTIISLSSLVIVWGLVGSGHNLGRIQRWREKNKGFLQFTAGAGLVVLAVFVYVVEVVGPK